MVKKEQISIYGDPSSENTILQIGGAGEDDGISEELKYIEELTGSTDWCLVCVPVSDWDQDLSPWPADAVFGDRGFGDGAKETLRILTREFLPTVRSFHCRKWILTGYSLGGLFALWASYETSLFYGVVAASPSAWFPGFMEYAEAGRCMAKAVYLSLGDKEEKAKNKVLATVGDCIRKEQELLDKQGVPNTLEWNFGNHFQDSALRIAKGIAWQLKRLSETDA